MRNFLCALLLCLGPLAAFAQEPLSRQLTLNEITQKAGSIVHGQIIDARIESHPQFRNVATMRLTLRIIDPIFGVAGKQVTYRLFMPPSFRRAGSPPAKYQVGKEVVLFMHTPSEYGLTSPVGGSQSFFQVQRSAGRATVVNALRNSDLFTGLATEASAQGRTLSAAEEALASSGNGPVSLKDFLAVVRQIAGSKVTQ